LTTIVTRAGKGSPLTNNEVDTNFTNLNDAKIETLTSTNGSVNITGTGSTRNLSVAVGGSGGGASITYYLNGSVNQGTISGNIYYEMNRTPILGAGTDFTISANGYIAQFITDANDPSLLAIPAGNWNFEMYFSASAAGGTPSFYLELYKYDGTTFTLISSGSTAPESITGGTSIDLYFTALAVPQTTLAVTDRLVIRVYVTHSGRTITLHTENSHLCEIITTFSTGISAINGLTAQTQGLTTGTSGSDFNISSVTDVHTFNLPSASASVRGALTSADWTTFNNKQDTFGSQTANTFYAAPNGSAGAPTFRAVAAADIPTLNQNTTGTAGNLLTSNGSAWVSSPPPSGGQYFGTAAVKAIAYNASNIDENITITYNSMSVGPITIGSGYSVTVNSGKRWVVL